MSTVLVVDDDPAFTRLMTLVLQKEGYRAWQACNGEGALAILEVEPPDLMLLDLNMPGMDGRSVCRSARAAGYKGRVLIVSGDGAEKACEELGADGALAKPFDLDALIAQVNETLH